MPLSREALSKETFFSPPNSVLWLRAYLLHDQAQNGSRKTKQKCVCHFPFTSSQSVCCFCLSVCHGVSTRFNGPRPRRHVHRSGQTPPLLVPTTGMFQSHWGGGCDVSSAASLRRRATATWRWPTRKMAPVSSANSPLLTSTETFATLWSQWTRPAGKRTTDCS